MTTTDPYTRPGLDGVTAGSEVLVIQPRGGRNYDVFPARVTVKKRINWTLQEPGGDRTWYMRADTQREVGASYAGATFATREQHEYDARVSAARELLHELDMVPGTRSPWRHDAGILQLAEFVTAAVRK